MSPENSIPLIDHAAAAGDRWLFVATLFVFICAMIFVARYFVAQQTGLIADVKEGRAQHLQTYKELHEKQEKTIEGLAVTLERCSTALNENSTAMVQNTEQLRLCREERRKG
jgi:hypothetical protein